MAHPECFPHFAKYKIYPPHARGDDQKLIDPVTEERKRKIPEVGFRNYF